MKRSILLAILVLAGSASFAGAAQAAVIDNDPVQLTSAKFDFGNNTFVAGAPTGSGNLAWDYSGGAFGVSPQLTGTLHLDNANGLCGRMRIEQFDAAGVPLSSTVGGTVCAASNAHQAFAVNLNPVGDPLTDHALISIERMNPAVGVWTTAASASVTADTHDDAVQINPGGAVSFGFPGSLAWNLQDGQLTPHLTGTLQLVNSAGLCARMKLNYLAESGAFITSRVGGTVCAVDNAVNSWTVDLDPYRDVMGRVRVEIQTMGAAGVWVTAGSQTVSVAA